jgi:hypothetical protein
MEKMAVDKDLEIQALREAKEGIEAKLEQTITDY